MKFEEDSLWNGHFFLLKGVFILLGIIVIIVGKYLSIKIINPLRKKYKVVDEKKYDKSYRMMFYCLGFYYILFGAVLMFISGWPYVVGIFAIMPPPLVLKF